jgi:hypothetical protein
VRLSRHFHPAKTPSEATRVLDFDGSTTKQTCPLEAFWTRYRRIASSDIRRNPRRGLTCRPAETRTITPVNSNG